jgi:hypothetical protein
VQQHSAFFALTKKVWPSICKQGHKFGGSEEGGNAMTRYSSLQMRLKIYLRRECYVWVCRRDDTDVSFGWIISYRKDNSVLFKDDEKRQARTIPLQEIESCGAV